MRVTIEPVGAPTAGEPKRPLYRRLGWFFGLAAGGVALTAAVAALLHVLMRL